LLNQGFEFGFGLEQALRPAKILEFQEKTELFHLKISSNLNKYETHLNFHVI
jgi:hypothetical protein